MIKRHVKKNVSLLLSMVILHIFLISLPLQTDNNHRVVERGDLKARIDPFRLKTSVSWDLWGDEIVVDNSSSSKNWIKTETDNIWCSGYGNSTHPYVIEEVYNCSSIIIRNSHGVHFIIRNCIASEISLQNVDNGQILSNIAFINLEESHANLISGNNVIPYRIVDFEYCGVRLENSHNNTILGNSANNIEITEADFCAIKIKSGHNNIISRNKVFGNTGSPGGDDGIYLEDCNDNTISKNKISENDRGEALRIDGDDNSVKENDIIDNKGYSLNINGESNEIIENEIRDNGYGLEISGKKNSISKNKIIDNDDIGIFVDGNDNSIKYNEIRRNNGMGIRVYNGYNNIIYKNVVKTNEDDGIYLEGSGNNQIRGNIVKENKGSGLHLSGCYENRISDNVFIGNEEFSILDTHDFDPYRMNEYGYNYCESEFIFIGCVIIGVISIRSVNPVLNFYRKVKFIKDFSQIRAKRRSE